MENVVAGVLTACAAALVGFFGLLMLGWVTVFPAIGLLWTIGWLK